MEGSASTLGVAGLEARAGQGLAVDAVPVGVAGVLGPLGRRLVRMVGAGRGRDRRIRTKAQELRQLTEAGLRVFWIGGKRDLPTWDWLTRLVRHWSAIEEVIRTRGSGPWFYAVNERGVAEIKLGNGVG